MTSDLIVMLEDIFRDDVVLLFTWKPENKDRK